MRDLEKDFTRSNRCSPVNGGEDILRAPGAFGHGMYTIGRTQEGDMRVSVQFSRPLLYLDTGPCGNLAIDDTGFRTLLRDALLARNGTFCVSWVHLLEFVQIGDGRRYSEIRAYLEGFGLNYILIEGDPYKLLQLHEEYAGNDALRLIDVRFYESFLSESASDDPPSLGGILDQMEACRRDEPAKWREMHQSLKDSVSQTFNSVRAIVASHSVSLLPVKPTPYGEVGTRAPRRTLDTLALDMLREGQKFSPNDVTDFCHAVVGTTYADYCILDNKWASRVNDRIPAGNRAATFAWRDREELLEQLQTDAQWDNHELSER